MSEISADIPDVCNLTIIAGITTGAAAGESPGSDGSRRGQTRKAARLRQAVSP